jgi:hypothetical protein
MKYKIIYLLALIFVLLPLLSVQAQTTSGRIPFSGTAPGLSGPLDLTFILYDADTGGTALYMDSQTGIDVTNQPFLAVLGAGNGGDIPAGIFAANPSVFIAIELTMAPGAEIGPRVPVFSSGYAHSAQTLNPGATVSGDLAIVGKLGIGRPNPGGTLDVVADTVSSGGNTANFAAPNIGPNASHIHFGTTGDWFIRSAANNGKVILQDNTGNVGIGTTNPGAKLHVQSGPPTNRVGDAIYGGCNTGPLCTAVGAVAEGNGKGVWGINLGGGTGLATSTNTGNSIIALLTGPCTSTQSACNIFLGQAGEDPFPATKVRIDGNGRGFFNGGTQMGGADFAESMEPVVDKDGHEPGDVLVIAANRSRAVDRAAEPYSTRVAGIYSTKPGVLATSHGMDDPRLLTEIPMAIVGIVQCKVSAENGSIERGDLLVTSSTPGHAMKGTDRARMIGAVVGKALEPLPSGKGVIQVLVTLQ